MAVRRLAADSVQPDGFAFTPENEAWAQRQMAKYPPGRHASAVIPLLWQAQKQHDYWLPKPAIEKVAEMLGMPYIRVLEIATFYSMFNLEPVGRHFIQLCGTTPCVLRGADDLKKVCRERIGPEHHISADGQFAWAEVECLGACCNAPMVQINDDYFEDLTAESLGKLMDDLAAGRQVEVGSQVGRVTSEPEPGKATTLTDETLFDGSQVGAWRHRFEEEEARERAKAEAARTEAQVEKHKESGGTPGAEPQPHDADDGDGKPPDRASAPAATASSTGTPPETDKAEAKPVETITQPIGRRLGRLDAGGTGADVSESASGPASGRTVGSLDPSERAADDLKESPKAAPTGTAGALGLHSVDSAVAAAAEGQKDAPAGSASSGSADTTSAPISGSGTMPGLHSVDSGAAAATEIGSVPPAEPAVSRAAATTHRAADSPAELAAMGAANEVTNRDRTIDEVNPPVSEPEPELTDAQRAVEETAMAAKLAALPTAATAEQRADVVGTRPAGLVSPRNDGRDDLKRIRGIGPVNERKLNELGIFHFDQIGAWHRAEIRWVGTYLAFPGRIDREKWVEQAKGLAAGGSPGAAE